MLSHVGTKGPSKRLNLGLCLSVAMFFLVYSTTFPSHVVRVDHQILVLEFVPFLNLYFIVNVLLHYIICYSGKPEVRDQACLWVVPKVEMCDQLLYKHIKTYMSKRWLMCSKLSWIYFSNVTVFQKHFWNYFGISLVPSASFFYLYSVVANNISWEWIWYLGKVGSDSEQGLTLKIRDQKEKCHFSLKIISDQKDETYYSCVIYMVAKKVIRGEEFENCFVWWQVEMVSKNDYSEWR